MGVHYSKLITSSLVQQDIPFIQLTPRANLQEKTVFSTDDTYRINACPHNSFVFSKVKIDRCDFLSIINSLVYTQRQLV